MSKPIVDISGQVLTKLKDISDRIVAKRYAETTYLDSSKDDKGAKFADKFLLRYRSEPKQLHVYLDSNVKTDSLPPSETPVTVDLKLASGGTALPVIVEHLSNDNRKELERQIKITSLHFNTDYRISFHMMVNRFFLECDISAISSKELPILAATHELIRQRFYMTNESLGALSPAFYNEDFSSMLQMLEDDSNKLLQPISISVVLEIWNKFGWDPARSGQIFTPFGPDGEEFDLLSTPYKTGDIPPLREALAKHAEFHVKKFSFSPNFTDVFHPDYKDGRDCVYHFNPFQAKVMKRLYEAWLDNQKSVPYDELYEESGSKNHRQGADKLLRAVFRGGKHAAWKDYFVDSTRDEKGKRTSAKDARAWLNADCVPGRCKKAS